MSDDAAQTRPCPRACSRASPTAARYAITGVSPDTWFGPQQPLAAKAPPEVKGRQWDYPFGVNLYYVPRSTAAISFAELRALADALPLLRAVIETRKDQIAALELRRARARSAPAPAGAQRASTAVLAFLARPDRRHSFAAWLSMLLEDMLVIDAATLYPRFTRGGALYCARRHRRLDHHAADRRGRPLARAARPRLSADPARRARRRLLVRRTALSAAQPARASALWHEPGRADRADRQHRAAARRGDARLLPRRLDARRLRDAAEGMDGRPDPPVPGLFRRADERQSRRAGA